MNATAHHGFLSTIRGAVRAYLGSCSSVDPAVAMGLFGTGVGMVLPVATAPIASQAVPR